MSTINTSKLIPAIPVTSVTSINSSASETGTSSASEKSDSITSGSEDSNHSSSGDSDEELFFDAIEASGTLISRYLSKNRSSRGDLTLVPGGSICEAFKLVTSTKENEGSGSDSSSPGCDPPPPLIRNKRYSPNPPKETMLTPGDGSVELTPIFPAQKSPSSQELQPTASGGTGTSSTSRLLKFEETLKRLSNGGEEEIEDSPGAQSSSQTSSVDGVYPQRSSRPFKVVEQDRISVNARSRPPDIISSCVANQTESSPTPSAGEQQVLQLPQPPPPIAPPRRRRRNKSPTISISSNICLDKEAVAGNIWSGVVTAQDEERTRSKASGPRVLRRTESLGLVGGGSGSLEKDTLKGLLKELTTSGGEIVDFSPSQMSGHMPASHHVERKGSSASYVRTKTDSGKMLSDLEILEQVTVVNLDTGERIPLSSAEDKIPKCINPLSLHIMRLTSEYVSEEKSIDSDDDSKKSTTSETLKRKGLRFRKLLSEVKTRAIHKARSLKAKSLSDEAATKMEIDATDSNAEDAGVKFKASPKHKGPCDFEQIQLVQDLSTEHSGPIWCMKFSNCGRLLATAGQDRQIRIWVLKSQLGYFQDLIKSSKVSPTPSLETVPSSEDQETSEKTWPFVALSSYSGHTADLLDIAWSKSFFLLSSSMDRTVRLWHMSRKECLCCFQHIDFVTAIAFHPRDDRYFLSGSLDGKLRLWNIPDKKVALWNEVPGPNNLITTANFCQNGKFAVIGTYDGRCIFYHTEQLKYHTQIILNRKKLGKITGIEPMPGEDKILVTSNDSRIRLYDLRDLSLTCKYTGAVARSSQIRAGFSHDGKFIISGSENSFFYIWRSSHEYVGFGGARRDRNSYWEGVKAHNAVVTCAVFAPEPDLILREMEGATNYAPLGYVLASADFTGSIKVFVSKAKQKCSSLPASAIA